jgi:hypothetical protein
MGSCLTKIKINEDMFLTLKSNPNDKLLLSLCLHYDIYDKESQRKIDELCQLSLTTDKGVIFAFSEESNSVENRPKDNVFLGSTESAEVKKENLP